MRKWHYLLVFILVSSYAANSDGEGKKLYKWRDANGNIVYSDQPKPGAEEIELKEVPTVNLHSPPMGDIAEQREALIRQQESQRPIITSQYKTLAFESPEDKGVVRNNAALIELVAKLEPALKKGHKLRFFLDGLAVEEATTELSIRVENIDYGPHMARYEIIDENDRIIGKSDSVSFALLHVVRKKQNQSN